MLQFYLSLISSDEDKIFFEKIYNEYKETMMYVALKYLKTNDKAEDAVHDAFLKIIDNIEKISGNSCPQIKAFCVITCRNKAIDIARRSSKMVYSDVDADLKYTGYEKSVEDQVIENANKDIITSKLAELSEIYRGIMYMSVVEEMSVKEIAKMVGLPKETIKKRIQRGRKILIDKLEKEGFQCQTKDLQTKS